MSKVRKVYVIEKKTAITQEVIDEATRLDCPEIASGIPPRIALAFVGGYVPALPFVFTELIDDIEPERDLPKEFDELKEKLEKDYQIKI